MSGQAKQEMLIPDAYLSPQEIVGRATTIPSFCLFSGGHDSVVATHLSVSAGYAKRVVHINTGTGITENRNYVFEMAEMFKWKIEEIHPPESSYEDFVLKYGFPGPMAHRYAYIWLKERALKKLVQSAVCPPHNRAMLLTGIRSKESARRMGYNSPTNRVGSTIWVAPIYYFSAIEVTEYMERHGIPRNPVVDLLHRSGECNCGAFAHPGEMAEMEMWFPETAKKLHALEVQARNAGVGCIWGKGGKKPKVPTFMPLCVGCENDDRLGRRPFAMEKPLHPRP